MRARHHYACFEQFGKKIETYGYAAGFGLAPTCERAVVRELVELRRENRRLRLEREILKKATAFFAKESE